MQHPTTWGRLDATTRFQGFVTAEDFLECAGQLAAHPRFDRMAFFVADFLDISGHAIDTPFVREDLAAQALGGQATNRHYRIVVISADAGIQAFTEKMRDLYDDGGPEIQMFTTREDAARWMASQNPPPSERLSRY